MPPTTTTVGIKSPFLRFRVFVDSGPAEKLLSDCRLSLERKNVLSLQRKTTLIDAPVLNGMLDSRKRIQCRVRIDLGPEEKGGRTRLSLGATGKKTEFKER